MVAMRPSSADSATQSTGHICDCCSTAYSSVSMWIVASRYGGSNQLTDVLTGTTPTLRKHTFDIQGDLSIGDSIKAGLGALTIQWKKAVVFLTAVK